ncbi:ankyrin repeat domain-containing protein [Bodo saltans virus]|uniref:Ankyrin repeat domain-containing protein n=1 Tax=Bodo saltans virus TaxID=2024608 RepID=A0A2H4UUE6_9VIRU|nr:ankyrin repeat domain-containing protein [Bodo saltans virus]ATZ80494.1 ankyrin repeat domain-containing protein [Bodo saltans virus]
MSQSFLRSQYYKYTSKPAFKDKPYIPEKEENDAIKQKLALLFTEGDYQQIISFMQNDNILPTLHSNTLNDESILHKIIKNDSLNDNQKLDLIKLAIENGTPVDSYSQDNITPLHLACGNQLLNIVDYLIKQGANINALDSKDQTPIYYAIHGKKVICEPPKKQEKFIKKNRSDVSDTLEKIINRAISGIANKSNRPPSLIKTTPTFNDIYDYLEHIQNYMGSFKNIFREEYKDAYVKYQEKESEILTDINKTKQQKKNELMVYIIKQRDDFCKIYKNFMDDKNNKIPIKIGHNIENGWTMDINLCKPFMTKIESQFIFDKMIAEQDKLNNSIKQYSNQHIVNKIHSKFEKFNSDFTSVFYFLALIGCITGNADHIENDFFVNTGAEYINTNLLNYDDIYSNKRDYFFDVSAYNVQGELRYFINEFINYFSDNRTEQFYKINYNILMKINDEFATSKLQYYYKKLIDNIEYVNAIINDLISNIDNNNEFDFIEMQQKIIYHLTNIGVLIRYINDEKKQLMNFIELFIQYKNQFIAFVNNDTGGINNVIRWINNIIHTNNPNINIDIFTDSIKIIDKIISSLQTTTFDDIYELVIDIYENFMKKYVNLINLISSKNSLSMIINWSTINTSASKYKIISNKISINKFPSSYSIFYDLTKDIDVYDGRNDYLILNKTLIILDAFNNLNIFKNVQNNEQISHGRLFYNDGSLQIDGDGNYGKMRYINSIQLLDNNTLYTLISEFGAEYISFLKFKIISSIINQIADADINYIMDISKLSLCNTYIFIAKILDRQFDKYIDRIILNSANIATEEIIDSKKNPLYTSTQNRRYITSFLQNVDIDFYVDSNDITNCLFNESNFSKIRDKIINLSDMILPININKEQIQKTITEQYLSLYNETTSSNVTCKIIDINIIELLLKTPNINLHNKDVNGHSPLFEAINSNNNNVVNLIAKHSDIKNLFNKNGQNSLQFAIGKQKQLVAKTHFSMCDDIFNNIFSENIKLNKIPMYTDILLPVAIQILNHHLFDLGQMYTSKWTFEQFDNLMKKIRLAPKSIVPLLDVNMGKEIPQLNYYNKLINSYSKQKKESNESMRKKEYLEKELVREERKLNENLIQEPQNEFYIIRRNKIRHELTILRREMQNDSSSVGLNEYYSKEILSERNNYSTPDQFKQNINDIRREIYNEYNHVHLNILSVYDYIGNNLSNIGENDFMSYPVLWEKYINNQKKSQVYDQSLFVEKIMKYQHEILSNENGNCDTIKQNLSEIKNYYNEIIMPFVKNYTNLPQEYNERMNENFTFILDIIVHIVKHFIMPSLYYIIISSLVSLLCETFNNNIYTNVDKSIQIKNIIKSILDEELFDLDVEYDMIENQNIRKVNMVNYFFNYLPKILVKKILNIYEGDLDKENLDKITIDTLFGAIPISLQTSSTLADKDSRFFTTMNETTLPFYIDHIQKTIEILNTTLGNYLRFLYTQNIQLQAINLLCQ